MSLTQHKRIIARHRQKVIQQQKKQLKMDAKIKQVLEKYHLFSKDVYLFLNLFYS